MADVFDVYIDGALDPSPAGTARLANEIASRFGIDAARVAQYLARGRFRVRSNVARADAQALIGQLQQLGARASAAAAGTPPPEPAPAAPPARPPIPAAARPPGKVPAPPGFVAPPPVAAPPAAATAKATPPKPPSPAVALAPPIALPLPADGEPAANAAANSIVRTTATPVVSGGVRFESGLAAAFAAPEPTGAELGALDVGNISLSALDGSAEEAVDETGVPAAPREVDDQAFTAPDQHDETQSLEVEELQKPPPAAFEPPPSPPEAEGDLPPIGAVAGRMSGGYTAERPRTHGVTAVEAEGPLAKLVDAFRASAQVRWALGVLLAVALGYVPVAIYASTAEDNRYSDIKKQVIAAQVAAETREQWNALDGPGGARTIGKADFERARGRMRTTSILIWLVSAGAVAWVYRKKVVVEE